MLSDAQRLLPFLAAIFTCISCQKVNTMLLRLAPLISCLHIIPAISMFPLLLSGYLLHVKYFNTIQYNACSICHPPCDWLVLSSCCKACPQHSAAECLPWKQNHENRLNYKLLKSFFFIFFLSFLKTLNATAVGAPHPPSMLHSSSVQSLAEALTGQHTQNKQTDRRTDRRTVGQGICHRWQSHSSFQSHPNFNRKRVGHRRCGDRWRRRGQKMTQQINMCPPKPSHLLLAGLITSE